MMLHKEFYDAKMELGERICDCVAKVEFAHKKLVSIAVTLDEETLISKIVSGLSGDFKHLAIGLEHLSENVHM